MQLLAECRNDRVATPLQTLVLRKLLHHAQMCTALTAYNMVQVSIQKQLWSGQPWMGHADSAQNLVAEA